MDDDATAEFTIDLAGRWAVSGNYVIRGIAIKADETESEPSETVTWNIAPPEDDFDAPKLVSAIGTRAILENRQNCPTVAGMTGTIAHSTTDP